MEIKARSLAFRQNLGIASEKTLFTLVLCTYSRGNHRNKNYGSMKRRFFTVKESYGRSCGK